MPSEILKLNYIYDQCVQEEERSSADDHANKQRAANESKIIGTCGRSEEIHQIHINYHSLFLADVDASDKLCWNGHFLFNS